jgi:hypothetical protein
MHFHKPTTVENYPQDADNLLKHIVKHREPLLLDIVLNKILLILRESEGVCIPRSQCSTEKMVKSVQLWKEIQHLGRMSLGTWSIHELHLIQLKYSICVNLSLWLHSQLMLKPK